MEGEFCVYILKGIQKRFIGCTSSFDKRFEAQRKGLSKFTKNGGPWNVEWLSRAMSHSEALRLEKLMKKQKGGTGLHTLMNEFISGS